MKRFVQGLSSASVLLLGLTVVGGAFAQEEVLPGGEVLPEEEDEGRTAENSLYLELLGPGIFYSLNYERNFSDFSGRIGIEYFSVGASDGTSSASAHFLAVPLSVSYLGIGSKRHMLELGGGITIYNAGAGASTSVNDSGSNASDSATLIGFFLPIGYRYQPEHGGFMLRAGISPLVSEGGFLPWPHVGLGATF